MRCNILLAGAKLASRFCEARPLTRTSRGDWRLGAGGCWRAGCVNFPVLLCLLYIPAFARADETEAQRAARLAQMPAEQKEELLRKKERFDALPTADREKLRELHASIAATSNAAQLQDTLKRYNDWLATLSSAERAELLGLPADERLAKITELVKRQESQRFREFAGNLPDQDKDAIFKWLESFVTAHEQELIERTPWPHRQRLLNEPDRRGKMLLYGLLRRSEEDKNALYPTREDFALLLPQLSEQTRREFDKAPATQKVAAARELIRAAVFSRFMPPVSDEDLRTFFAKLNSVERERLESLDRDQMKRELTRMYHSQQFRNREGFAGPMFGPPGGGPPGSDGERRGPDGGRRGPDGERPGPDGPFDSRSKGRPEQPSDNRPDSSPRSGPPGRNPPPPPRDESSQ